MRYCQIAFVSKAKYRLSETELDDIIMSARANNLRLGITGVLLYHPNTFFEFIEGNVDSVNEVYKRIKQSRQHHQLFEVYRGTSQQAYFNLWTMGFCYPPKTDIQTKAHEEWAKLILQTRKHSKSCTGLKMLLEFWGKLAQHNAA